MAKLYYYYHRLLRRSIHRSVILFSTMSGLLFFSFSLQAQRARHTATFDADDKRIQYTGRIDFTNHKLPRFWQPGVMIAMRVEGFRCGLIVQDEILWGKNHNYIELVVDGRAIRMQTKTKRDTINVQQYFAAGKELHDVQLVKNTEANIGYMEFVGVSCSNLVMPPPKPKHKIEFIGNSITCGAGSDPSAIPCGKGEWHDQHNAYLSYGPITARTLNTQYHLSSVSGIGLMHSCCNMNIIMPPVFDKISMRNDSIAWDFNKYQPDVVTICLGQNDGIQDSAAFCSNYIAFVKKLRGYYPKATFICLTSPMADASLAAFMKKTLTAIVNTMNNNGDKKVTSYFFSKQYHNGCDYHPDLAEHQLIADELTAFIRKKMKW